MRIRNSLRVLIVSQHFWPEQFRINELAQCLSERRHIVCVLSGKPNYPFGQYFAGYSFLKRSSEQWGQINIKRVPIIRRGASSFIMLALNYLSFVIFAAIFGPFILRKKRFDVVYCYGTSPIFQALPGLLLAKLKGAPFILNVQDLWPESLSATGYIKNRFILSVVGGIVSFIYNRSDEIIVPSVLFVDEIKKLAPNAKITYIPNSVIDDFTETDRKRNKIAGKRPFRVVYAGNIGTAQSMETIVQAANQLKIMGEPIEIHIYGDGSRLAWLKSELKQKSLENVTVFGQVPRKVIPTILSGADCLLILLRKNRIFELTIPNKLQAYLAAGKPIVGSLDGIGSKILDESKAGKGVEAENHLALAKALVKMSKVNETTLKKFGCNALNYFNKHFDNEKLVSELEVLMQKAVLEKRRFIDFQCRQ